MAWVRFILIFILLIQLTVLYSLIVEALQLPKMWRRNRAWNHVKKIHIG